MSNDKEWIGKEIKKKYGERIEKVENVENGRVYTDHGSNIPVNKINENFDVMDPDAFFNDGARANTWTTGLNQVLSGQVKSASLGSVQPSNDMSSNIPVDQVSTTRGIKQDVQSYQIDPNDAPSWVKESMEADKKRKAEQEAADRAWEAQMLGKDVSEVEKVYQKAAQKAQKENIQRVEVVRDDEGNVISSGFIDESNNGINPINPINQTQVNPMFSKMKKTQDVDIQLIISEKIPKITAIKTFAEMFDDDIIEYLSKQIANEYLKDPSKFVELIKSSLEDIILNGKKPTTTRKRKTTKKTTTTKKVVKPTNDSTRTEIIEYLDSKNIDYKKSSKKEDLLKLI